MMHHVDVIADNQGKRLNLLFDIAQARPAGGAEEQ